MKANHATQPFPHEQKERTQRISSPRPYANIQFWPLWLIFEQSTAHKRSRNESYELLRPSFCRFIRTRDIKGRSLQSMCLFKEHHTDYFHAIIAV